MIRDGENGLMANFFDPDDFAEKALRVLRDPAAHRPLGRAAEQMIEQRVRQQRTAPKIELSAPPKAEGQRPQGTVHRDAKVGRNDPCPCGSGKKYKKCHGAAVTVG